MAAKDRDLDVTITRKGRREDRFEITADPRNPDSLSDVLTGWLRSNKWHRGRWGEFELTAREHGGSKVLARVGAS